MIILTYNFVIHSYIPYIFVPGIYVLNPLHMNTNDATYFKALSTYRNTDMYLCIVCSYLLHKYHIHTHDSSHKKAILLASLLQYTSFYASQSF